MNQPCFGEYHMLASGSLSLYPRGLDACPDRSFLGETIIKGSLGEVLCCPGGFVLCPTSLSL